MQQTGLESIRNAIDELAAKLVLEQNLAEARDSWAHSLMNLAAQAAACGNLEVQAVAAAAAAKLEPDSKVPDAEAGSELENSISSLRALLLAPEQRAAAPPPIAEDPELIADFVVESREHLQSIEKELLRVEDNSGDIEPLHSIFRSFHTIKGLSGFLELPLIQEVAHEVETVLDKARMGQLHVTPPTIDTILASKDYVARWLDYLESERGGPLPENLAANQGLVSRIRAIMDAKQQFQENQVAVPETGQPAARTEQPAGGSRAVKVDTAKLDHLVDMVGEMVIAQSLVRHNQSLSGIQDQQLIRDLGQLARITDEVQRTAMSMRMVPIGPLFQRMARLVRDLSRRCGKKILFECDGEDVELDRNIVEELADALMHMVRNAVDHGIEPEQERLAAGKPPTARIHLRAFHRSGQIVIEVSDDGRGIDTQKVVAKARAKGLVGTGTELSEAECFNLIFQAGFSTAEKVSDVSGRGVGMDVVKKQIQKLRGSVDISSVKGEGTRFSLRLPLTLAIIDGLVVSVGTDRYIVPLGSVKEMLRPGAGMVSTVENRAEVVAIRDRLLPMFRLYRRFGTRPRTEDPTEAVLIVADVDGDCFCLMVDELIGKQEVVIKSLGPVFASISGVAGGAILGDGKVGLILDLKSIYGAGTDA